MVNMGTEKALAKHGVAIATLGMALFWPFFTHPVYPTELLAGAGSPTSAMFLTLFFAASIACALLVVLWRRFWNRRGRAFRGVVPKAAAPVAAALYVALLVLAAASRGTALSAAAAWSSPLALAVLMASLGAHWASAVSLFDLRTCAVTLTASLALSTVFSIVAQDAGAAIGLSEATSTQVLPLASAFLTLPARTPDTQAAGRQEDGPGPTATPGPARAGAGMRWIVMVASLFLFLLGSGVFRSAFTAHAGYEGVTQDWPHRIMLLALAGLLVGWALFRRRRPGGEPYPWLAFLVVCLIALYCGVVFYPLFATFANEVMLPTRPVAIFLMWVAAGRFAQSRGGSPALASACLFLPFETLTRVATTWMGDSFWTTSESSLFLEVMMLVTALALTLGMVAWLLLGMRDARESEEGEGRSAAGAKTTPAADEPLAALKARYGLSERETEVMALLARGYTQKRVAEELSVSVNSVQTYAKTLYRKLGVHSRQEIIDLVAPTGTAGTP